METSQILLNNGLAFLAIATGIMLVVVGGFLIKLLIDLSKLTKNVDETTYMVRNEVRPTIRELNESLHTLNTFVNSADKNVDNVRESVKDIFSVSASTLSKMKILSGSLMKGVFKGFTIVSKMFSK